MPLLSLVQDGLKQHVARKLAILDSREQRMHAESRCHPAKKIGNIGSNVDNAANGQYKCILRKKDVASISEFLRYLIIRALCFFFLKCGSGNKKNIFVN